MRRGLLDIITVVLLLVGVAAVGFWVRGTYATDSLRVLRGEWVSQHGFHFNWGVWVVNSGGRVTWRTKEFGPQQVDALQAYQARDFQMHWEAGPATALEDGVWMGWVVLGAMGVPAGRGVRWFVLRGKARQRGMRERALAVVAWLAGAAAVGVGIFWGRSYPYFERVDWKLMSERAAVQLNSSMGSLMVAWTYKGPNQMMRAKDFSLIRTGRPPSRGPLYKAADLVGPYVQVLGFTLGTDQSTTWRYNVLIVPYWFLEGVTVGVAVVAWRAVRRRERWVKAGRCAGCGYDLRATPERCPECGLEVMREERGVAGEADKLSAAEGQGGIAEGVLGQGAVEGRGPEDQGGEEK